MVPSSPDEVLEAMAEACLASAGSLDQPLAARLRASVVPGQDDPAELAPWRAGLMAGACLPPASRPIPGDSIAGLEDQRADRRQPEDIWPRSSGRRKPRPINPANRAIWLAIQRNLQKRGQWHGDQPRAPGPTR